MGDVAFDEAHRLRVECADHVLLHDVGDYVRYDGHHKHSYYLISNSDIMGLTPDERATFCERSTVRCVCRSRDTTCSK